MRPQFNMLRAVFFLLSLVVLAQVAVTMIGGLTCFYLFISGKAQIGACADFTGQVRELWAEVLAAVLALLLASRGADTPTEQPPAPPAEEPPAPDA